MPSVSASSPLQHGKALATLSSTGAAVAGVGVGLLLPGAPASLGAFLLAAGLLAHVVGMVGRRRTVELGVRPPLPERIGFWSCWAIMLAVVVYAAVKLF